jgi:hypothetical protein
MPILIWRSDTDTSDTPTLGFDTKPNPTPIKPPKPDTTLDGHPVLDLKLSLHTLQPYSDCKPDQSPGPDTCVRHRCRCC